MADSNQGTGLIHFIKSLFAKSHESSLESSRRSKKTHLEAKYWPEVMDYMEALQGIIKNNTIEDDNIAQVNERITDYILEQINKKGAIEDINKRYMALETLADRILVIEINKLAGLKQNEGTLTEFSDLTKTFKKRLMARRQEELRNQDKLG